MRVLGVDPGLTRCGLGVVDGGLGRKIACVAVDVVRTPPDLDLGARLVLVADAVESWIAVHRPDVIAIERVFAQHNVRTAMGTAQVGGVVALIASRHGLPMAFHTPSEVKAAVSGSGRADKSQVAEMVRRLLNLEVAPTPADASDALAIAICHSWRAPVVGGRMAEARLESERLARTHRAKLAAAAKVALQQRNAEALRQRRAEVTR